MVYTNFEKRASRKGIAGKIWKAASLEKTEVSPNVIEQTHKRQHIREGNWEGFYNGFENVHFICHEKWSET